MVVSRFDVGLVALDPTMGNEIGKARPCLIVSPDELSDHRRGSGRPARGRSYPTRNACTFEDKEGQVVLDRLRAVDRRCPVKRLGRLDETTARQVSTALLAMFAW